LAREATPARREAWDRLLGSFLNPIGRIADRGRLAAFASIGSGVVEGAAKTLGLRLKARGARWRHVNARAMAALICCRHTDPRSLSWSRAA